MAEVRMTVTGVRHRGGTKYLAGGHGGTEWGGTGDQGAAVVENAAREASHWKGHRVSTHLRHPVDPRIVRIIKCLRMLEDACYSAEDLAGRLQVSKRTVYRDLQLLTAAGVPLAKRVDDGGYHVLGPQG
jgi:hypothetical protein